jgi:glyoxylase-like metal-dependent hydrolase (beta-lactamase superfamily II)
MKSDGASGDLLSMDVNGNGLSSLRFIERDWLSSNNVFLVDGDEATIVDTGYAKHAALTVAIVRRLLEETGTRLTRIVNTHLHSDHCGGNRALAEAFGARVIVPEASLDDVRRWDEEALSFAATGQRCERFEAHDTLAPGDEMVMGGLRWHVHAAPGHDPKSLVFHCEAERLMISADALWQQGFGVIFPEIEGQSGYEEQQAILELIAALPVERVFPGHGAQFTDVRAALDVAFARLRAFREHPGRLPRHALKVLVKYLMLDLERVELEPFVAHMSGASVPRNAARQLSATPEAAVRTTIDELVRQGHLGLEEGWLRNVGD